MSARRVTLCALVAALAAVPAAALVSTSHPSALLVFPWISVSDEAGSDTLVQITNVDETGVAVHCQYQGAAGTPPVAFSIRLAGNQPAAWRAGAGAESLPNDGGSVPALGAGPLSAVLRCLAVDANDNPIDRNVLVGSATLERLGDAPASLDAAQYNATGLAAVAAPNADRLLQLGGPGAEYAACPAELLLQTFFDGAVQELGAAGTVQRQISTTLAFATCAHSVNGGGAMSVAQFRVVNEFGQQFTANRPVQEHLATPMSLIDTGNPVRSIFHTAVQGTDSGSVFIAGSGGALLALARQQSADPVAPTEFATSIGNVHEIGERQESDVVDLALESAATPTPTVTETPTTGPSCVGDCDGNGTVAINELITGVGIALGSLPFTACPQFDSDGSNTVAINELIAAVNNALTGC
jgi:hypothetical protein